MPQGVHSVGSLNQVPLARPLPPTEKSEERFFRLPLKGGVIRVALSVVLARARHSSKKRVNLPRVIRCTGYGYHSPLEGESRKSVLAFSRWGVRPCLPHGIEQRTAPGREGILPSHAP